MKVAVIGGGSTYTPELINGFLDRTAAFPLRELWLLDIDRERLEIVGRFVQRMAQAKSAPFVVHLTTDLSAALREADYVITQLRVGGMKARREDEYLGRRHGLIGQETTGVGGMAKALRTIPVILGIAAEMHALSPSALLVNFTNPAGLVTEALARHAPQTPAIGVCNVPMITKMEMLAAVTSAQADSIDPGRAELQSLGLNHLSWHRGLTLDGEDIWPHVLERILARLRAAPDPEWDTVTIETLRMIPNHYLKYYYDTHRQLAGQASWPPSRAEEVMRIEAELLRQYSETEGSEPPPGLLQRGGAYYSTVATQLMAAHHADSGETHVVNAPHAGAVAGYPTDWVLELPCRIDRSGAHPIPADPLPAACFGLLAAVKSYETLTVEAALSGDRGVAYQALLAHPLGPPADQVRVVLDDLLQTNRAHLPRFFN